MQISWQVANLHVQISWQVQHFVNLHVQISWHAQHFVHLHVQISWQAQHEMPYFSMEPVAPKLASQGLRNDRCETVSGHSRNRPSIGIRVFTCFLKISLQVQHFVNLHVQISWGAALCEPPCADFVAGTALCAPPCADFVAGAIQTALWRDSERTKCCIFQRNRWLRSWQVKVCGTTGARRSRVILGSFSDHSRNRPSIGIRVFTCFLK